MSTEPVEPVLIEGVGAVFPEQQMPRIATPEELAASGEMPQIPYAKLSRVPDGWEGFLGLVLADLERVGVEATDRTLTLVQGRQWTDHDDPDRPQTVTDRIALFGIAADEGLEPDRWIVAVQDLGHDETQPEVETSNVTDDRTEALGAYTKTVRLMEAVSG